MRYLQLLASAIILIGISTSANAQFLDRLLDRAERGVKNEIEAKVDKEARKATRCALGDEVCKSEATEPGDEMINQAVDLVCALYENADRAANDGFHPLNPANAQNYFSADLAKEMQAKPLQADPLFGAQAFEGSYAEPVPDPEQPMLRGMITVNVEITNFDQRHTAKFRLRADPDQPGSPIRIFRIEHDGWSFP